MATTQNTFNGNGSNLGPFSFTFKWLESTDIKVSVGGVLKTAGTHYNLQGLNYTTKTGGQVLFTAGNAPPAGTNNIRIYRDTDDEALSAVFSSGSAIRAKDLNDNFTQNLYVTQEINNNSLNVDGSNPMVGPLNMNGFQIDNLAEPTTDSDAATKKYIDDRYGNLGIPGHTRWRKVATANQTIFLGTGDYGGVLAYSPTREQVYINGALQQRGVDYAADNGTSVIFTVGLTVGDVVDIICINNLTNSAISNAANITYSGQFTGQTARTVAAKLGDVVSVKDFGAIGDGVADDTAKIQAALDTGKTIFFPKGTYRITNTLHVNQSGTVLKGAGRSDTTIEAGTDFTGSGELVAKTMIQVNKFPHTAKIFYCGLEDIAISSAKGGLNNPAVECLVHANWAHHFFVTRTVFYGAYGNGTNGTGLILTSKANTGPEWAMFNTITDSDFTYCVNGILWGAAGHGDVNVGQVYRTRFGGGGYGGVGIKIESSSYANSFVDNDIEGFATAFYVNPRVNYLRGNLAEQNALDFRVDGPKANVLLVGNELNVISSESAGVHLNEHGTIRSLLLDATLPSLLVDGNFRTNLYETPQTTLSAANDATGGQVLTCTSGNYIQDHTPLLLANKGLLNGWYTFVVRAKASAGGGLFFKLPAGKHNNYHFAAPHGGAPNYVELLEANSHTFVAGIHRTGALSTEYKTYYGSVYFTGNYDPQSAPILLASQTYGSTITIDYIGLFEGTCAGRPSDTLTWTQHHDLTAMTAGSNALLLSLPSSNKAKFLVTSIIDGAVTRAINSAYMVHQNGGSAAYCYWTTLDKFGHDAGGSTNGVDHLWLNNANTLRFFCRTPSLAGTDLVYFKFEVL